MLSVTSGCYGTAFKVVFFSLSLVKLKTKSSVRRVACLFPSGLAHEAKCAQEMSLHQDPRNFFSHLELCAYSRTSAAFSVGF